MKTQLQHSFSWAQKKSGSKIQTKKSLKKITLIEEYSTLRTVTTEIEKNKTKSSLRKTKKLEAKDFNHKGNPFKAYSNKKVVPNHNFNTLKKYDYLFSDVSPEKSRKPTELPSTPCVSNRINIETDSIKKKSRVTHFSVYSNIFI